MRPFQIEVALRPSFRRKRYQPSRKRRQCGGGRHPRHDDTGGRLHRGCRKVLLALYIESAGARALWAGRSLLGGEREGVVPPSFDFGNSPVEYARADLTSRELLFVTTNGTRALRACAGGYAIFAGSYRNAEAVAQAAIQTARSAETRQHCHRLRRTRTPASIR